VAITQALRAQVRRLGQASRNAHDGLSLLHTADGALAVIAGMLIRGRERRNGQEQPPTASPTCGFGAGQSIARVPARSDVKTTMKHQATSTNYSTDGIAVDVTKAPCGAWELALQRS
jgi:hypothetical protein